MSGNQCESREGESGEVCKPTLPHENLQGHWLCLVWPLAGDLSVCLMVSIGLPLTWISRGVLPTSTDMLRLHSKAVHCEALRPHFSRANRLVTTSVRLANVLANFLRHSIIIFFDSPANRASDQFLRFVHRCRGPEHLEMVEAQIEQLRQ